jgi:hypothetical protein
MLRNILFLALITGVTLVAGPKRLPGPATSGNDIVDVYATVITDRQEITKLIGMDPGMDLVVVDVKVAPKAENKLRIDRDDFTLLSSKDGQRTQPLEAGQIAGKGSMVVSSVGVRGSGGTFGDSGGPIWGRVPGTGPVPSNRPMGSSGIGNSSTVTEAKTTVNNSEGDVENPLLAALKAKILPQMDETNDADSGLLYFLLDGKVPKQKDLSLIYKSPQGRVIVEFK